MNHRSAEAGDVLFIMHSPAYVRNFESVLGSLASRGHRVTVAFEERKQGGDEPGLALMARLGREHGSLSYELRPSPRLGLRGRLRVALEALQDYLRYFDPPYEDSTRLRARAIAIVPSALERALALALSAWPRGRRALAASARRISGAMGADPRIRQELETRRPGVLVVTPLVHFRSRQREWVRAAGELGIGTMFCVHSWDNLTNRGLMHAHTDRIAVWNDAQRTEVVELHGARTSSVHMTGAWPYDHWFGWRASRSRDELCRQLGLPEEPAIVLYVCSSRFIAEHERPAVMRWVSALRSSADPRLATASVIVRPHPLNHGEWSDPSVGNPPGMVVFPPRGAEPVDEASRADYFDSLVHADAVVGVNTSALIESAILDRPALAFPAPDFRTSQAELPHFRHLVGDGGMLQVSRSMAEHIAQLGRALADPSVESAQRQRFVETFIRPRGASPSPTDRVVAATEELAAGPGSHWASEMRGEARIRA